MEITKATENALEQILRLGQGLAIKEVAELAQAAQAAGGTLVAVEPDGDGERCGSGRIIFKWPLPKGDQFEQFLDAAVKNRIQMHILINGIRAPDELQIEFGRTSRATMAR